jgi:cell wall-associated NlpC family hydrolase
MPLGRLLGPALAVAGLAACVPGSPAESDPNGVHLSPDLPAWVTSSTTGRDSRCLRTLTVPARTVLEHPCGTAVAFLTEGAYTARLMGPARTFTEPSAAAPVNTHEWVRVLPAPFGGTVNTAIKDWVIAAADDPSADLLALSMQYLDGAPPIEEGNRRIAGDADYGPLGPDGSRIEGSDFYDYLGVIWTFADGAVENPMLAEIRSLDCSGYMRMLWGVRAGLPLGSTAAGASATSLSRRAVQMEAAGFGVAIDITRGDGVQAGDLVFFDADPTDGTAIDHVGMYLGRDDKGNRRFISSRKGANGPTLGDVRGASILDGVGLYAKSFRSARRL